MTHTFDTAQSTAYEPQRLNVAPGSVVVVRDEEWLVTSAVETSQGTLVRVQGISELVRDTHAAFYSGLDDMEVLDPAEAKIVWDDSRRFRLSRLFLETTLRTTPAPILLDQLTVSTRSMATPLKYQQLAIAEAISTILLAGTDELIMLEHSTTTSQHAKDDGQTAVAQSVR